MLLQYNLLVVVHGSADSRRTVCLEDPAGAEGPAPAQNPDQSGNVAGCTKDPFCSFSGDPDSGEVDRSAAGSGTTGKHDIPEEAAASTSALMCSTTAPLDLEQHQGQGQFRRRPQRPLDKWPAHQRAVMVRS